MIQAIGNLVKAAPQMSSKTTSTGQEIRPISPARPSSLLATRRIAPTPEAYREHLLRNRRHRPAACRIRPQAAPAATDDGAERC
jgi:hypothetical protein